MHSYSGSHALHFFFQSLWVFGCIYVCVNLYKNLTFGEFIKKGVHILPGNKSHGITECPAKLI